MILKTIFLFSLLGGLPEFDWVQKDLTEDALVEFKAELLADKRIPTKIVYRFDRRKGGLQEFNAVDEDLELIVTEPHTQLWQAHLETKKNLDYFFSQALKDSGYIPVDTKSLEAGVGNSWKLKDRNQILSTMKPTANAIFTSSKDLLPFAEAGVKKTREQLLELFNSSALKPLRNYLIQKDVIEPFVTETAHDESRFDGFSLYPLKTYLAEPDALVRAIAELAQYESRYPLEWYVEARGRFSHRVRLATLMLLTHNHLSETFIIQAIAFDAGLKAAWKFTENLNRAYGNERQFWIERSQERIEQAGPPEFPTGIRFLDRRQSWLVNVAIKPRILIPVFGLRTSNQKNMTEYLPYHQLYHFIGAFVLAIRLREEKVVPDELLELAVSSIGMSYKLKTMGLNKSQIKKMRLLYSTAAKQVLRLGSLLN